MLFKVKKFQQLLETFQKRKPDRSSFPTAHPPPLLALPRPLDKRHCDQSQRRWHRLNRSQTLEVQKSNNANSSQQGSFIPQTVLQTVFKMQIGLLTRSITDKILRFWKTCNDVLFILGPHRPNTSSHPPPLVGVAEVRGQIQILLQPRTLRFSPQHRLLECHLLH